MNFPTFFDQIIKGEYDATIEGGYSFEGYTLEEIAWDIIAYSPAMEELWVDDPDYDDNLLRDRIVEALMKFVPSVNN